jgi:NAD(P)-dependent dehydrogenase (short-subunit alcohol dehydrogenase family)
MRESNVLITGVHTGLGLGLARACLQSDRKVYAVSRNTPKSIADYENFVFRPLDLRRFDDIPKTIEIILGETTSLDLVFLNAGILGELKDLKETSLDEIRAIMEINVYANKVLVDTLMGLGMPIGHIVAISSGSAFNGSAGWGGYSISKSALNLLVRVYAHEHPGTHFTALAPGLVGTDMLDKVLGHPEVSRYEALARIRAAKADGRVMSTDIAADLIMSRIDDLRATPTGAYVDIRNL